MKKVLLLISIAIILISSILLYQFRDTDRMFNSYTNTTIQYQNPYTLQKIRYTLNQSNKYDCFDYGILSKDKMLLEITCKGMIDIKELIQLFKYKNSIKIIKNDIHGPKVGKELLLFIKILFGLFLFSVVFLFYFLFKKYQK